MTCASLVHSVTANSGLPFYVKGTLILANNTLQSGVDVSPNPAVPSGSDPLALDPKSGNLFFSESPSGLFSFNINSNRTMQLGNNPDLLTYDSFDDEVFASYNSISVYNGTSDKLVANVSAGDGPEIMAVDSNNGNVYVADSSDSVAVINTSLSVVANITNVGSVANSNRFPSYAGICFDPKNNEVYISSLTSNSVLIISTTTNTVIKNLSLASSPGALAYDPADGYVYASEFNRASGNVAIVNPASEKIIANVRLPMGAPGSFGFDPGNGYMYVSDPYGDVLMNGTKVIREISTIESSDLVYDSQNGFMYAGFFGFEQSSAWGYTRISGGMEALDSSNSVVRLYLNYASPTAMDLDTTDGLLYVAEGTVQEIYAINTSTDSVAADIVNTTSKVAEGFSGIVYDGAANEVYALSDEGILIVNATTNKIVESILGPANETLSGSPYDLAYDSFNRNIYVGYYSPSELLVINGTNNQIEGTIPTNGSAIAINPYNGDVYVTSNNSTSILSPSNDSVVGALLAPNLLPPYDPVNCFFDASNEKIYIPFSGSNTVEVLNAATDYFEDFFTISEQLQGIDSITYVPNTGDLFAIPWYDFGNNVSVIDASSYASVANLTVGVNPVAVMYDPSNGESYVLNSGSGTLSIIVGPYDSTISNSISISESSTSQTQTTSSTTTLSTSSTKQNQNYGPATEFGAIVIGVAVVAVAVMLCWGYTHRTKKG